MKNIFLLFLFSSIFIFSPLISFSQTTIQDNKSFTSKRQKRRIKKKKKKKLKKRKTLRKKSKKLPPKPEPIENSNDDFYQENNNFFDNNNETVIKKNFEYDLQLSLSYSKVKTTQTLTDSSSSSSPDADYTTESTTADSTTLSISIAPLFHIANNFFIGGSLAYEKENDKLTEVTTTSYLISIVLAQHFLDINTNTTLPFIQFSSGIGKTSAGSDTNLGIVVFPKIIAGIKFIIGTNAYIHTGLYWEKRTSNMSQTFSTYTRETKNKTTNYGLTGGVGFFF